jgi:TubC N-terminal docking domain
LLQEIRRLDVRLEAEGSLLHVDAPVGAITEELRAALEVNKQGLMELLEWERRRLKEADRRGFVTRWSVYPTWIELHDPLTGEWHEVRASECLPSIVETANQCRRNRSSA